MESHRVRLKCSVADLKRQQEVSHDLILARFDKLEGAIKGLLRSRQTASTIAQNRNDIEGVADPSAKLGFAQCCKPGSDLNPFQLLLNLKQEGTIQEYRMKFELYASPLKIQEKKYLIGLFLNGLKPEIRAELKVLSYSDSWDEIIRLAELVENKNRVCKEAKPDQETAEKDLSNAETRNSETDRLRAATDQEIAEEEGYSTVQEYQGRENKFGDLAPKIEAGSKEKVTEVHKDRNIDTAEEEGFSKGTAEYDSSAELQAAETEQLFESQMEEKEDLRVQEQSKGVPEIGDSEGEMVVVAAANFKFRVENLKRATEAEMGLSKQHGYIFSRIFSLALATSGYFIPALSQFISLSWKLIDDGKCWVWDPGGILVKDELELKAREVFDEISVRAFNYHNANCTINMYGLHSLLGIGVIVLYGCMGVGKIKFDCFDMVLGEPTAEFVIIRAANRNTIPGDVFAMVQGGIRMENPALTSRRFIGEDFLKIAEFFVAAVRWEVVVTTESKGTQLEGFSATIKSVAESAILLVSARSNQWPLWLCRTEYRFLTTYTVSLKTTISQALYGRPPPVLFGRETYPSDLEEVTHLTVGRDILLDDLREILGAAQQRVQHYAYQQRRDISFEKQHYAYAIYHTQWGSLQSP